MKRILPIILTFLIMALSGCDSAEDHPGEAKTPSGSSIYEDMNYHDVKEIFENQGFKNISLEKDEDLITGWMHDEGDVKSVSVDGNPKYAADKWYPNDVEVVITYHAFPEEDKNNDENKSANEKDTDDESKDVSDTEIKTEESLDDEEILTVQNCSDLEKLLSIKADTDEFFSEFADKYKNRIITFDGCITYMVNHADYKTRYDLLVNGGDYISDETDPPGPQFKFDDVGNNDMGIDELFLPDYVSAGSNIHITAKVVEYNENSSLFLLDPVKIEER